MGIAAIVQSDSAGGDSPLARSFGAKVEVASGSLALCLVVTAGSPLPAVNAVGARVLAQLSPTRVIAVVDMTLFPQLQHRRDVLMAGPISVDPARFAQFQRIVGVTS